MTQPLLPVTFTFISLIALLLIPLTGWVGLRRDKVNVLRGDGGDAVLFKRIRIHGNLMENIPLFALVLGASEYAGLGVNWLWVAIATFAVGRIAHFVLYDSKTRGAAMFVTLLPGALMSIWLVKQIWL
ncbi:MAG: MAPEG family protein [Gammaproteobacteria bacterium]|nr:MAPEG family protein [Gammaproteobacteria bacterium]